MGAGYHGGFGHTKGAEHNKTTSTNQPVLRRSDVRFSTRKTEGYLLNINHPIGGSKAKFMRDVLGYTSSDAKLFHENVVNSIIGRTPTKTLQTQYGLKHTYHTTLTSKEGKNVHANVVVVVQKDKSRVTYKIITVYPDNKEK